MCIKLMYQDSEVNNVHVCVYIYMCVCVCVCVPVSVFASQRGKSTIKSLVYLECLELMCIQGTIKPAVMSFKVSNPS